MLYPVSECKLIISMIPKRVKLNILIDFQASLDLSIRIEKLKQFKSNNMLYIQI